VCREVAFSVLSVDHAVMGPFGRMGTRSAPRKGRNASHRASHGSLHQRLGSGARNGRDSHPVVEGVAFRYGYAFGAAGPALGYLAQVDYALLAALERMDDADDSAVSIETLDDIVFHDADSGDATEKWQSKYTIDQTRSLSLCRVRMRPAASGHQSKSRLRRMQWTNS
jgi:hypothetical protein